MTSHFDVIFFIPFSAYAQSGGVLCSLFVLDGKAQGYGKLTKSS